MSMKFMKLAVALLFCLCFLEACDTRVLAGSEATPKIAVELIGTWSDSTMTSEWTFDEDGTGQRNAISAGTKTYSGSFLHESASKGSLLIKDDNTGVETCFQYWISEDANSLELVDQSLDTTRWRRAGTFPKKVDTVALPVLRPSGGNFSIPQLVTISAATPGATIYYTTDGSTPSSVSNIYTLPFTIDSVVQIRAIAVKSGMIASSEVSGSYTIPIGSPSSWNSSIDYGVLRDERDGRSYRTVKIGRQTWMAEDFAGSYSWSMAMGIDAIHDSVAWTSNGTQQGICPSGWHLPSIEEWKTLVVFVGGDSGAGAGRALKSTIGWFTGSNEWWKPDGQPADWYDRVRGLDTWGFRVLGNISNPGGSKMFNYATFYWTSTPGSTDSRSKTVFFIAWMGDVGFGEAERKGEPSVRCLQDGP